MTPESKTVYLYRTPVEGDEAPFEAYRDLARTALSGLDLKLPGEGTILLKANATVLFPPEKRVVTHPGFLAGVADVLKEKGVAAERIVVGDGQSGEQPDRGHSWAAAGYEAMVASEGIRLAAMNETETRTVRVPDGVVYTELPIYAEVTDCAFFFNVPLAKCHNLGCTTLTIKNLMGILGRPERHLCNIQGVDKPFEEGIWRLTDSGLSHFEDRFYHKLCDVLAALRSLDRPRLCVVDGLIGRDGTAFNEGQNYPLGWTAIGENEVHVDTVATYLMGLDPAETPYLTVASDRGLGTHSLAEIDVVDLTTGEPLDEAGLSAWRSKQVLMPMCRYEGGYYNRFRADGSAVPWRIDEVNRQRQADGEALVPVE